jgi:hypothetical protein
LWKQGGKEERECDDPVQAIRIVHRLGNLHLDFCQSPERRGGLSAPGLNSD